MSHKELDRVGLIEQVVNRQIKQAVAAERLSLSVRQVKRLVRRYRTDGAAGLASKRRGRPSNNRIDTHQREAMLTLIRSHYPDFSPTLAHEKLTEVHKHQISVETLRQWMTAEGLWKTKPQRKAAIHQSRPRRAAFGELIQIDGSPHDWFEGHSAPCTLIVFIDDATSQLMRLYFCAVETTEAYMSVTQQYLAQYGRPAAIYSDRHSIFRNNHPGKEGELTQFTRALKTLDIEAIHANTPQAKGRVERANQTLQDRLTKEMRLQRIHTPEAANAWVSTFIEDYNQRFGKPAKSPEDGHRPVLHTDDEQAQIFSIHAHRKLSKNLTFRFKNREYQLTGQGNGYRLRGAQLTVCEAFDGSVMVLHEGSQLAYRILEAGEPVVPVLDEKTVRGAVENAIEKQSANTDYKPAPDHPWRRMPVGTDHHTT